MFICDYLSAGRIMPLYAHGLYPRFALDLRHPFFLEFHHRASRVTLPRDSEGGAATPIGPSSSTPPPSSWTGEASPT
jgi:hypothetical protein